MKTTKSFDGRLNIYQVGQRGCGYNPSMRQWELYEMEDDGSIQDLSDRVNTKAEAMEWIYANN